MKGGKLPLGYTIVEVMIVLAVSSIMFLIAASFINGKQARTAFTAGTNEMASQVQDIIEQVTDGKYSDIPFKCTVSGLTLTISPAGGSHVPDCTFLGKFVHFPQGSSASSYEVFSLVGAREVNSNPPASLLGDLVTAITPFAPGGGGIEFTTQATVPQSLDVKDVQVTVSGVTKAVWGIGFVQSLGSTNGGSYISGAQTIGIVYAPSLSALDPSENLAQGQLGNLLPADSAAICLTDGGRFAQIILGTTAVSQGGQLSATVRVEPTC
jgi:prepilin-type N-terminal cleavage/methylation domain-containing protein